MASASGVDWRPTASLEALRLRARMFTKLRRFFAERDVLEVETPSLAACPATDVHIHSLTTRCRVSGSTPTLYLQTSPEFAMKRLLASGSGPIYQVSRVFRDAERGPLHNPEFTLLEWYRPGFDHHTLMDELDALLDALLEAPAASRRLRYREAFVTHTGIDPFDAPTVELQARSRELGLVISGDNRVERDLYLEFIFSHALQARLGNGRVYVYDFPPSQAALARVREGEPCVAERFELFLNGIEIANGYHELGHGGEQQRRFDADNRTRERLGLDCFPVDERLLAALEHGLPDCAGVAVGLDRLVMIAAGASSIEEVIAFPISRA